MSVSFENFYVMRALHKKTSVIFFHKIHLQFFFKRPHNTLPAHPTELTASMGKLFAPCVCLNLQKKSKSPYKNHLEGD